MGNIGVFSNRNSGRHYLTYQETLRYRKETKKNADLILNNALDFIHDNPELFKSYKLPEKENIFAG
ncbi:MAG: hypothetical protein LUF90_08045 [Rikenellaceae bacterium]|nr:hypothetical protein [Rikenellaceae bacterium]